MSIFKKKQKLTLEEEKEVALIRAMESDGIVRVFYYDFVPVTPEGKKEWLKYHSRLPEKQPEREISLASY